MQEVNILCTDSGPLRADYCIVGITHNTAIQFAFAATLVNIVQLIEQFVWVRYALSH